MARLPRNLSTWFILTMLCGMCMSIASLAYTTLSGPMESPVPKHKEQANCSHPILRSFYKTHHSFPESGVWLSSPGKKNGMFVPSMCELRYCDVFGMFRREGITYVLFLGDSQGRYSFFALRKYITSSSDVNCTSVRLLNRSHFFSQNGVKLLNADTKSGRFGRRSVVSTILCNHHRYNYTVKMQFILIDLWNEAVIVSGYRELPTIKCSFVEFIFKYYLHDNYPGLVVFFSLFNHIKKKIKITKSEFLDHVMPLRNLIQSVLPRTTWVQWLTNPMEFDKSRKKASSKSKDSKHQGHLAGDVMIILSRWLFDVMADLLVEPDSNHLGFFNVANMTSSLASRSRDGVHLDDLWYEQWMAYVLETMCHGL